ncbi:MAG: hypothetical protein JSR19_02960 [Proteobacteria bacterium]|nr:hypothetical protein [Pseudomonadota bacterium]HQR03839.1 hypothetical protein [Rhodocyclaceae bacterium]
MTATPSALEALPHLSKKVCLYWGSPEFEPFINALVLDTRDGKRQGLPMVVGAELLWLVGINKWHRALAYQEKLGIGAGEAYAKVQREDLARDAGKDPWLDPASGGRGSQQRHTDRPSARRPRRRKGESTWFGILLAALTSRIFLGMIVLLLTVRLVWPWITLFLP